MSATQLPQGVGAPPSGQHANRGLTILVTILTVVTLGLAGWLAYLLLDADETAMSSDVAAVSEEYRDAWNTYDAEAFLGLVTSDFQFFDTPGTAGDSAETTAAMIRDELPGIEWTVTEVGSPLMSGDGSIVQVSMVNRISSTSPFAQGEGISLLTLVQRDGTWKVQTHIFLGA